MAFPGRDGDGRRRQGVVVGACGSRGGEDEGDGAGGGTVEGRGDGGGGACGGVGVGRAEGPTEVSCPNRVSSDPSLAALGIRPPRERGIGRDEPSNSAEPAPAGARSSPIPRPVSQ